MNAVLALDQGTTGSTALVIGADGRLLGRGYRELPQHFPAPGQVEHDLEYQWRIEDGAGRLQNDDAEIVRFHAPAEPGLTQLVVTVTQHDIKAAADRLAPHLQSLFGDSASVEIIDCFSQIGSGALPVESLPSKAVAISPNAAKKGGALKRMAAQFARLPVPVIGRIQDDRLIFDLRCLNDEDAFISQLADYGDRQ